MSEFLMPSLGPDMESAQVVEWLVKVGARVRRGDLLCVVETEKGAIDVEVFTDGVVRELIAPLEVELPVGAVLARIDTGEDSVPPPAAVTDTPTVAETPAADADAVSAPPLPRTLSADARRRRASPAARRLADERGLALEDVTGTGPDGVITLADVGRAHAQPVAAPRRGRFDPGAMRHAIGQAVSRSKRDIPHYYLTQEICLEPALDWLELRNRERPVGARILPAAVLLRATALALAEVEGFNGHFRDGQFAPGTGIHIGWAVSLRGGGLVVPAIVDANTLAIDALMAALRDLIKRARGGGLRSSELTSATVTVTSIGERGADAVWPVIYPPQVAMIGFGRIAVRPRVVAEKVLPQRCVTASLAADHRVSDGHTGSRLLAALDAKLHTPAAW